MNTGISNLHQILQEKQPGFLFSYISVLTIHVHVFNLLNVQWSCTNFYLQ